MAYYMVNKFDSSKLLGTSKIKKASICFHNELTPTHKNVAKLQGSSMLDNFRRGNFDIINNKTSQILGVKKSFNYSSCFKVK